MLIEGPITVGFVDDEQSGVRELRIGFKAEFQALAAVDRHAEFVRFATQLKQTAAGLPVGDSTRQGMLVVLQVVEEITPYLQADEIPLDEEVAVNIQPDLFLGALATPAAQ